MSWTLWPEIVTFLKRAENISAFWKYLVQWLNSKIILLYLVSSKTSNREQLVYGRFFSYHRVTISLCILSQNLKVNWSSYLIGAATIWELPCLKNPQYSLLKPSISSHSKPRTKSCTRWFKCFVVEHSVFKTKHLRHIVQDLERGLEWLEILGLW